MRSDLSKSLDSRAERGDHFLPIAHAPGSHLMGIPAFSGKPKKSCTMLYPNTASEAIGLLVYYLYRRNGPYGWKFCFNMSSPLWPSLGEGNSRAEHLAFSKVISLLPVGLPAPFTLQPDGGLVLCFVCSVEHSSEQVGTLP